MRRTVIVIMSHVIGAVMAGTTAQAADLTVAVANLTGTKGAVRIAVYDRENGWPEETPQVAAAILPVLAPGASVTFHGLAPGDYAASAFHDEDENGQLNRNFIGVPTEGYGFSNGSKSFTTAKFNLTADGHKILMQLTY